MVSFEVPKPPLGFFERARESLRLASAFFKGDRTTIRNITSETVFSPNQPLVPYLPGIVGRTWDYPTAINLQFQPDSFGRIRFHELRGVARQCEIMRIVIQMVKDQICAFDWQIVPKEDSEADPEDPRVEEITRFFRKPDKINPWDTWLRMLLDDFLVLDAVSIYRPKDQLGRPYAFELFDSARIKVLIDANGRRPQDPDPAYQQIIKGSPRADYTTDEMLYMSRNITTDYPIRGISAVENVIVTGQTIIERQKGQLQFFTEGTLPDSYAKMPEGMTTDAIKAFEERFNDLLRGNTAMRRGTPFLPSGAEIVPLKQTELKSDADEWFARIVCSCFGVPPTAFIKQMNRSTSESDADRGKEDGQFPKMQYVKLIVDELIGDFGDEYADNFEFSWREGAHADPKVQADVITEYVKAGVKTINEGRNDLGLDPITGGDDPMALTPTGYVPLDSFEQQQQMQQQNMQAQAEARAAQTAALAQQKPGQTNEPTAGGKGAQGASKPNDDDKPANKLLGKAVRHKPLPFHRPIVEQTEPQLVAKIHHILEKTAAQVVRQLKGHHWKLAKDDSGDVDDAAEAAAVAGSLDLSGLDALIDATPEYLDRIAADSGKQALATLGVFDQSDLVNQVNQFSLSFARQRAAEMVGKKWVDGELVDNPNADWVISDATRDELRDIIGDIYSGDLNPSDLQDTIQNAGAFSEDRAKLIARTELQNANAQGTLAGFKAARDTGIKVLKSWYPDETACEICLENADDGDIDLDSDFSSGDDAPPAHPACGCSIISVTDSSDGDEESDAEE